MKITKKNLQKLIKEETEAYISEQESETPRSAHIDGSEFAGAGKYIGKGGNKAYEIAKCKKSWERNNGKWVYGMEYCEDLVASQGDDSTPSGDTAQNWQANTEERIDSIEQRLQDAGINEAKQGLLALIKEETNKVVKEFINEADPGQRSPFKVGDKSKSGAVWGLNSTQGMGSDYSENEQYIMQMVSRSLQKVIGKYNLQIKDLYDKVDELSDLVYKDLSDADADSEDLPIDLANQPNQPLP